MVLLEVQGGIPGSRDLAFPFYVGFDLVLTVMNHSLDRGVAGLKRTLDVLDRNGIEHTGTARTDDERNKVFLRNINGIRLALQILLKGNVPAAALPQDEYELPLDILQIKI